MTESFPALDRSALRVKPATIVALLVFAFVGGWPWLVAGVGAAVMLAAAAALPGGQALARHGP